MQREVSLVYTSIRRAKGQKIKLRFVRLWSDLNYCVMMHNVEGKHWIVNSLTTLGNGLVAYWLHFYHRDKNPWKRLLKEPKHHLVDSFKGFVPSWQEGHRRTELRSQVAHVELDEVLCWLSPPLHSVRASSRWGGPLPPVNSLEMQTYLEVCLHLLSTSEPNQGDSKD